MMLSKRLTKSKDIREAAFTKISVICSINRIIVDREDIPEIPEKKATEEITEDTKILEDGEVTEDLESGDIRIKLPTIYLYFNLNIYINL